MNRETLGRLKKISERLKKSYDAEKVILFGSYARGEKRKNIRDQFIRDIFENGISL